jgi:hypothetical protein
MCQHRIRISDVDPCGKFSVLFYGLKSVFLGAGNNPMALTSVNTALLVWFNCVSSML